MLQHPPPNGISRYGCSLDLTNNTQLGGSCRVENRSGVDQIFPVYMFIMATSGGLYVHNLNKPLQIVVQASSPFF